MKSMSETYKKHTIAIAFDGTCVSNKYPNVGDDIGSVKTLRDLVYSEHKLILHTKRVGNELEDAVRWFRDNNIELFGVNENPSRKLWSGNSKVYATRYIDSESLGTPLDLNGNVDWVLMTELIKENMMLFERRY